MRKMAIIICMFSSMLLPVPAIADDDDPTLEKLMYSVWELKVKYYNGVNLFNECAAFDDKYIKLNESSFQAWFDKNDPLFQRVLTVFAASKERFFDNPENHKVTLKKQFLAMPDANKHKLCASLAEEYESPAMDFEKSHKEVFLYVTTAEKHR